MKFNVNETPEQVPAGKRSIRETVYGNTNAYVGRRFWKTLGPTYAAGTAEAAAEWLAGNDEKESEK